MTDRNPAPNRETQRIGRADGLRVAHCLVVILAVPSAGIAQSPLTPAEAMRPIGSPSAVDRYQMPSQTSVRGGPSIRRVAMQSGGFALPPMGEAAVPQAPFPSTGGSNVLPTPPPNLATPRQLPGGIPPDAAAINSIPRSVAAPDALPGTVNPLGGSTLDYEPITPPQLANGGFSTMADCRLITPPSTYSALSPVGNGCGCSPIAPVSATGIYAPPPAQIAAPAAMPPVAPGTLVPTTLPPNFPSAADAAPIGSLVTFGQEQFPVQVGQGLWGQPVAYVPGQSFRNWLRYFSF
ncbi:MAG: hypothetical protein AAGJ40_07715 [Planctomycetota bacterium]